MEQHLRSRIQASADNLSRLAESAPASLARAVDLVVDVFERGGKLLVFGNGGSACDALHIEAELVNRFRFDRAPLPAIALTLGAPTLTSIGNDSSFDEIFERGVRGLGRPGDLALGISTSGRSRNVIRAMEAAREMGLKTCALVGLSGGPLASLADVALHATTDDTPGVQECHLVMFHLLCDRVEAALFPGDQGE